MIIHSNCKQLRIDHELTGICKEIIEYNKTDSEWNEIESSDLFQTEKYCGGYDGIEQSFCFSYFENKKEYWFCFQLNQVSNIIFGKLQFLDLQLAER